VIIEWKTYTWELIVIYKIIYHSVSSTSPFSIRLQVTRLVPEYLVSYSLTSRTSLIMTYCASLPCAHNHLVVCLRTGPKPLPKQTLHIVRYRASSFKWEYPLLSLRPSSSFLRLLPHLAVISIPPFIFLSITCYRRQFLRDIWPIQLTFRLSIKTEYFIRNVFAYFKYFPYRQHT
jgi:hypothetical protein